MISYHVVVVRKGRQFLKIKKIHLLRVDQLAPIVDPIRELLGYLLIQLLFCCANVLLFPMNERTKQAGKLIRTRQESGN